MYLDLVKQRFENFITDDHNDLIILSGCWGIGKTYFWNNIINKSDPIIKEKYCYISMFGIKNLEQLKNAIIANLSNEQSGCSLKNMWSHLRNIVPRLKFVNSPLSYVGNLFEEIVFSKLNNLIICFDDIERITDINLMNDFIGLLTQLKENKECKIVIILNRNKIEDKLKKQFTTSVEKIVNIEIELIRTPTECVHLLFHEPYLRSFIADKCELLELRNIRVMQRIKRMIEDLDLWKRDINNYVRMDIISSICLFMYCHYCKERKLALLTLDDLSDYHYGKRILHATSDDTEFQRLSTFLDEYNYMSTNDTDKILIRMVKGELIENQIVNATFGEQEMDAEVNRKNEEFNNLLQHFRGSIIESKSDFLDKLEKQLTESIAFLDVSYFNVAMAYLIDFGEGELANTYIDQYIGAKIKRGVTLPISFFDDGRRLCEPLLEKLKQLQKPPVQKSLKEVLDKVLSNGWSHEDELRVSHFSVEDYIHFFESQNEVGYYIYRLLDKKNKQAEGLLKKPADIAYEALKILSEKSKFMRAKLNYFYKITFED